MTGDVALGPAVAFSAGLLSFLSPCVLPLVPSWLGFLTGMTLDEMSRERRTALLHALLFTIGFSLVFMALGAGATALGATLRYNRDILERVAGVVIIVFGLYTMGVLKIGMFDREQRLHVDRKPVGYLGSVLVGMAFAAGWTPCLGPILSAILMMAGPSGDVQYGVLLLGIYSLGLALPFLLVAFAIDRFGAAFMKFRRWIPWVQRVSGVMLVVVGILLVTGEFTRLASMLQGLTPEFLRNRV